MASNILQQVVVIFFAQMASCTITGTPLMLYFGRNGSCLCRLSWPLALMRSTHLQYCCSEGIVGCAGLLPTVEAIKKKKTIALANKETLIAGGPAVLPLLKEYGVDMVPADSEHSAIFQCLQARCCPCRLYYLCASTVVLTPPATYLRIRIRGLS